MFARISPIFFNKLKGLEGTIKETNELRIVDFAILSNDEKSNESTIFLRNSTADKDEMLMSADPIVSNRLCATEIDDVESREANAASASVLVELSGLRTLDNKVANSDITAIFLLINRVRGKLFWQYGSLARIKEILQIWMLICLSPNRSQSIALTIYC